jgi:hypothetical protein
VFVKKIAQNVAEPIFCKILIQEFYHKKFGLHTSEIVKTLPKINIRPIGKNLPKLVTLEKIYVEQ